MRKLRCLFARLAGPLRSAASESRMRDEFETHIAMQTEEYVRAGMPAEEARRQAMLRFGAVEAIKEEYRDQTGLPIFEVFGQDLRYTWRTLRKDSGFTTIVIAILAIGIGASVAIFSMLNAVLLRPLPFYAADRLVWIENQFPNNKKAGLSGISTQVPVFWEWQKHNRSFEQLEAFNAFYGRGSYSLAGVGEPERLTGVEVSQGLFPMLGVHPAKGRLFLPEECQRNGRQVAVLSHGLWERRFGSDPNVVGRNVLLNDSPYTIVGVMPETFDFAGVFAPGTRADLFVPAVLDNMKRWGNTLMVIGRLKHGVTIHQAQAEFDALMPQLLEGQPNWRGWTGAGMHWLQETVSGRMRGPLLLLAGAVALVLLIVCVNVGNLLLARAASRHQELAVRVALGADRKRLVSQMLTESLLLALIGGGLGVLLAVFATRLVAGIEGVSLPLLHEVRVDQSALLFSLLVTVASGVLFGLVPAFELSRVDPQQDLKDAGRGSTEGRSKGLLRKVLVASEVALACLLLVGAGLLMRSFLRVLDVDLGFRPDHVASLRVDPTSKYRTADEGLLFLKELVRRVRDLPGVERISLTDALPLDRNRSWSLSAKGRTYPKEAPPPGAFVRFVLPEYFETMGIAVRKGRDFRESDTKGSKLVMIVNESAARFHWPGDDPVGKVALTGGREFEVIGVVADVRHSGPEHEPGIEFYMPSLQNPGEGARSVDLVMRTSIEPAAFVSSLRTALRQLDPNLPLMDYRPLETLVNRAVSQRRVVVWLLAGFAGVAVLLAALGIYGVISYSVSRRTQEIGVRMALGASATEVQRGIIRETVQLAAVGVVAGLSVGLAVASLVSSLLYGVEPRDPLTFVIAPLVLVVVALLAGYLPARRASSIDPMIALRVG